MAFVKIPQGLIIHMQTFMKIFNKILDIFEPNRLFFRWFTLTDIVGFLGISLITYLLFVEVGVPKDVSFLDLKGYWFLVGLWFALWLPSVFMRSNKKALHQVAWVFYAGIACFFVWNVVAFGPEILKRLVLVNADRVPDFLVSKTVHVENAPFLLNAVIDCNPSLFKEKEDGLYVLCDDKVYRVVIDN